MDDQEIFVSTRVKVNHLVCRGYNRRFFYSLRGTGGALPRQLVRRRRFASNPNPPKASNASVAGSGTVMTPVG